MIYKVLWRNSQNLFWKNQNWVYLWINSLKFYTVCFYCMSKLRVIEIHWSKTAAACFYLIQSFFKKTERALELVSLPHFPHDFWRKMFLTLYFVNWPNFIVRLRLVLNLPSNLFIIVLSFRGCEVINTENNVSFLIRPFFCIT